MISIVAIAMVLGKLVLLRIDAETLRNEVNVDSLDMLKQSGDWRKQLLGDVPLGVNLQLSLLIHQFLRVERFLR